MKKLTLLTVAGVLLALTSCSTGKLITPQIGYQSVRLADEKNDEMAASAEILTSYAISADGNIVAIVFNRTDDVMTIDQTKSFFVNSNGVSTSYYDQTVYTTSNTDFSSTTSGASLNLGALAGFFGVGGRLGGLLGGIGLSQSAMQGSATTYSTAYSDLPQISLAPHGSIALSRRFNIIGLGRQGIQLANAGTVSTDERKKSPVRFTICITYHTESDPTPRKLMSDMYMSYQSVIPVNNTRKINDNLKSIFADKPDALFEPWWMVYIANNIDIERDKNDFFTSGQENFTKAEVYDSYVEGMIIDFQ